MPSDEALARIRANEAAQPDGRTSSGVYLPYWRACSCDVPPLESIRTVRDSDGDHTGMRVLLHPAVCPQCGTAWRRGRVTQAVG